MQLAPIFLVAALMAVDSGLTPVGESWGLSRWMMALAAIGPLFPTLLLTWLGVWRCIRQLARGRVPGPIVLAERLTRWSRLAIVIIHVLGVTVFGWLDLVRSVTGDLVFVDEFVALLPALLGLSATWWIYYPVERRLRDALLIRRMDEGLPVYPLLGRMSYVLLQVRLQLLLLLVPVLLIMLCREAATALVPRFTEMSSVAFVTEMATLGSAALVFVLSPLLARVLLDVRPMAAGELRDELLEVCRRHRVKMRELLVWNTNGSMINAAVMGLISPLRYVLITDALIETLWQEQVRAVMAHEIGHVKRHHMPWLIACLLASFIITLELLDRSVRGLGVDAWATNQDMADWMSLGFGVTHLILGLLLFGWVCRRFERQADTFAVQHLSGMGTIGKDETPPLVTEEAGRAMRGALESIAMMNTVDRHRRSWRHGSIAWRQNYLKSIVGRPVDRLPIDRLMRWIKVCTACVLLGALAMEVFSIVPPAEVRETAAPRALRTFMAVTGHLAP
jgi:STE24 endopeptidase